ncbi:MAG: hypothetical protein IJW76_01700 [Clostridia bacterium]|nr:hypothetical protein [Clostridia bacterium]
MDLLITIWEFAESHAESAVLAVLAAAAIIALCIFFAEYREKALAYITHRRNKCHTILLVLFAAALFALAKSEMINLAGTLVCAAVWCLYLSVCVLSMRPKTKLRHPILRRYGKMLDAGLSFEVSSFFEKEKHAFLLDIDERLEYTILRSTFYSEVGNFEKSYKLLAEIEEKYLYREEKEEICVRKARLLMLMGNFSAACDILGEAENCTSGDYRVWETYSFIAENRGETEKAFEHIKKAKSKAENACVAPERLAQVLNNYARVALINGNREEARQYYSLAYEKAKNSGNVGILHVVMSNLIARKAIDEADKAQCEALLADYKKCIPEDSVQNIIEYNNCAIEFYRQVGDDAAVCQTIKSGFDEIYPRLVRGKDAAFCASTFRMLMNGKFVYDWFDACVETDREYYMSLPTMERLAVFNEYMGIFSQHEYSFLRHKEPYASLYKLILDYYETDAVRDIDEMLAKMESYNISLYRTLVLRKLSVLKLLQKEKHIEQSMRIYMELYKTLCDAGMYVDALDMLILFMDECGSPYNIKILTPHMAEPMYYSEFLARISPPPPPKVSEDGYHLVYNYLHPVLLGVWPQHAKDVEEMLLLIEPLFEKLASHPAKLDKAIHIAHFYMCLGKREEARKYYDYFKSSEVSPRHFARWLREEYDALKAEFE